MLSTDLPCLTHLNFGALIFVLTVTRDSAAAKQQQNTCKIKSHLESIRCHRTEFVYFQSALIKEQQVFISFYTFI